MHGAAAYRPAGHCAHVVLGDCTVDVKEDASTDEVGGTRASDVAVLVKLLICTLAAEYKVYDVGTLEMIADDEVVITADD